MKTKLTGLTIALLAFSSTAMANINNNHYYYVAIDAGIIQADFNNKFIDHTDLVANNIAQTAEQHGYTGGIAFGYRKQLNKQYFVGGELSGNIDGNTAAFQSGASNTAFSDKIQLKNHFDFVCKFGTLITDTFETYLKLGLSYAFVQDKLVSPVGATTIMTSYGNKSNLLGVAAGFGFEKILTNQTSLFTEVNYHDYGTANLSHFQNFSSMYSHSSHVYAYDAKVGVSYAFC